MKMEDMMEKLKGKKKEPMIKPSHKGLLHEKLKVPKGEKIPKAKIAKAAKSGSPKLKKEAIFAENFGGKKGG